MSCLPAGMIREEEGNYSSSHLTLRVGIVDGRPDSGLNVCHVTDHRVPFRRSHRVIRGSKVTVKRRGEEGGYGVASVSIYWYRVLTYYALE